MDICLDKYNYEKQLPCKAFIPQKPPREPNANLLIDDIMKKYFCQKARQGSSCSLFSIPKGSNYSMDKRLQYWSQILEDRKRIACRIQRVTGKRISHVLYNQTEEYRHVQNVKRVIDIAQRLHPSSLQKRKATNIRESLYETLPLTERLQKPNFEFVGTPNITLAEQWLHNCTDTSNSFLRSSYLRRKLEAATKTLIEFYPDITKLQVVGRRIPKHHRPSAEVISDYELSVGSLETKSGSWPEFPEYCLQINDCVLRSDMCLDEDLAFHLNFEITPDETTTQTICRVKNIGKKPVYMSVRRVKPEGSAYMPPFKKVFFFNFNSIRLAYGEAIAIEVTFRSEERRVQEDVYYLLTNPNFFEEGCKIYFKLTGNCDMPQDFFHSIIEELLNTAISGAIPGLPKVPPKKLTDTEMFEKQNPGFMWQPQDLQKFYAIYAQIKRKQHPKKWNMNLQTLKEMIEGVTDFTQRTTYMEIFMRVVCEMRGRVLHGESRINILLARSVVVTHLDKWETKAQQIKHTVSSTDLDVLIIKMAFQPVIEQVKLCKDAQGKRRIILHNALYIQMYCCLCELAEDMVSFVENCLKLRPC